MEQRTVSRLLLWSCNAAMVGVAAAVNVTPVCLSSVAEKFGLDYSQQGILLGCTFWGFIIALFLVGPLSDRYGPRPFFYWSAFMQIGGFLLLAFAWNYPTLAFGATLAGLGAGILETLLTPVICETFPTRKTSAVNRLHSFYALGAVGIILLTSGILRWSGHNGDGQGWRWAYMAMLVVPITFGVGFFLCFRIYRIRVSYPHSESYMHTLKRLRCVWFFVFAGAMLCAGGTELGAAQWLPSYLEKVLSFSRETGAAGLLLLSLAMGLGRITGGWVANYLSAPAMLILAGVMCAGCLIAAGISSSGVLIIMIFLVFGFFVGWMWPTTMAIASEAFPHTGSTMFALLAVSGNGGGIVFPGAVGFLAERFDLRIAMSSLAVIPCVASTVFFLWRLRQHRRGPVAIPSTES